MIAQGVKPRTKPLTQKNETSTNKKKSRLISKNKLNSCKVKTETLSSSRTFAGPTPFAVSSRYRIGRPMEDPQLKLKVLELTPRNRVNQTSQGVQNFIKQVSKFIEKKNPFKGVPEKKPHTKYVKAPKMLEGVPEVFNLNNNNSESKKFKSNAGRSKTLDKSKKSSARSKEVSKSKAVTPVEKRIQKAPAAEAGEDIEQKHVKRLVGSAVIRKSESEEKPSLDVVSSRSAFGSGKNAESLNSMSGVSPSPSKRKRRSEIPLRKVRTDSSNNPKPVSLLLQKPLKENESAISIDMYPKKKPFTPIEELSICSEIQSPNVSASSEALNGPGKKASVGTLMNDSLTETSNNGFKLDRCCKSPNIPVFSNSSFSDVADEKLCTSKKSKVLDIDKVKTSSFTVLRNNREALCRLESLHKQNVYAKENAFSEKVLEINSSKLKILTPKSSFNSLKRKSSKKNLSTRLSSKGNKPALKIKTRKTKKDIEDSLIIKKCQKAKSKTLHHFGNRLIKTETTDCFLSEDPSDEELLIMEGPKQNRKLSDSNLTTKLPRLGSRSSEKKETASNEEISTLTSRKLLLSKGKIEELEKGPKSPRNSTKKAAAIFKNEGQGTEKSKSKEKIEPPPTPPPTPESGSGIVEATILKPPIVEPYIPKGRQTDEDERSSSKTITLEVQSVDELSSFSSEGSETKKKSAKIKSLKRSDSSAKRGSLKFGKDEPPEKPEGSEPEKNKIHIKIDLTTLEDANCNENTKGTQSLDWLFLSNQKYNEEHPPQEGGLNDLNNIKASEVKSTQNVASDSVSEECGGERERNGPFDIALQKSRKNSSFLRTRPQYKVPNANMKGVRKKKIRSDAGDRRLPSAGFFNSVSFQNKIKLDTKLRSGLTKSYALEEKQDIFEDTTTVKLKRRNSEPISFRGYIWKRADSVFPRGHKASASSMASSLRHLNTDDMDDFIFWEAIPQKMTSCWEMSLYHFKRPWSVLSCSVFDNNRQSTTPGLILENLRNGKSLSPRRSSLGPNERVSCPKENPFDVEPSIAQKNIDIRNWLAALNFPTPPSTSTDAISEGNFSTPSTVDAQNLNKSQVNPKRRKGLPSLKFSDESTVKKADEKDKYKKSTKWNANEIGLMNLIRRKSGGFVTNEQFFSSEHTIHRPKVTVNVCLYANTPEDNQVSRESIDRNLSTVKTFKTEETTPSPGTKQSNSVEASSAKENHTSEDFLVKNEPVLRAKERVFLWGRMLKGELVLLHSDFNIWKYLFLFTIFIISVHYCFLNNSANRS